MRVSLELVIFMLVTRSLQNGLRACDLSSRRNISNQKSPEKLGDKFVRYSIPQDGIPTSSKTCRFENFKPICEKLMIQLNILINRIELSHWCSPTSLANGNKAERGTFSCKVSTSTRQLVLAAYQFY